MSQQSYFPPAYAPTQDGIIAVGGEFTLEILIEAYRKGIFPWPQEDLSLLLWFSPDERGVLDFADFHVPESLQKFAKKNPQLKFALGEAFREVMTACMQQARPGQKGTWILPEMVEAYEQLFRAGKALSLECWENGILVGGIYGVLLSGLFSGESMFFRRPNASKMCLWKMVEHLKSQGHTWMDIQMVTPVTASFGGKLISRSTFLRRRGLWPDLS